MKRFALAVLAAGTALAAAAPASATLFIGVSVNGGAINQVATDGGSGSANYNTTAGGFFYNVSATGVPLLISPQLLTQSVNIMSTGGVASTIDVYITQNDLTSLGGGLLSTFTTNTISGATAQLRSYFSASDILFGGTQLQSANFTSGPSTFQGSNPLTATGLFSETVRYTLNFSGGTGSNFNGTANLAAVPEAATWGMMILGFGVMGGVMRRRKTTVAFA
ncbi:PEPxxWA-CTERM sorting domain-containing protein [uncultured Sphingomonas sp.]|uniref:PEPxxWA-CTERM sorting domain-containing protein n=1 Tax=uncultured Sphingomonas sp. TaxID=158754 RepID=UPI0035CAC80B